MERFRLGTMEDAEGIFAMYRAAAVLGQSNGSSVWDEDYPDRETLLEDLAAGRLLVLEEEGNLLASIALLEAEESEAGLPWTQARPCFPARLCVAPGRQGKGLGERVMRLLAARVRAEGCGAIRLMAAVANQAANRLYARMHYRRVGLVHMYDQDFLAYELLL
ncbi:MAG TPA: GNAT family N-acetyltransferase [Holophaga sp.]|nr:GNAT family N-acetyltransferase [Holophaga sp.]